MQSQPDKFHNKTVAQVFDLISGKLSTIYSQQEARNIAMLLAEELNISRTQFISSSKERTLTDSEASYLENALYRLLESEPIQYILEKAFFYEEWFEVNPNVLIPRSETEELVHLVIKNHSNRDIKILDIGTGSGCIAISLKKNLPNAQVEAIDFEKEVLELATRNAKRHDTAIHFHQQDILNVANLPDLYNLIVSNPPYVLKSEKSIMHQNVVNYEPPKAIFISNESPLIFYECIIELGLRHLIKPCYLYFEINEQFGQEVKLLADRAGYTNVTITKDINGKDRFVSCELH